MARGESRNQRVEILTMPVMTSLFAAVLPLRFPLQNLRARNGNNLCRELLEAFEWRFGFSRFGRFHAASLFHARKSATLPCYRGATWTSRGRLSMMTVSGSVPRERLFHPCTAIGSFTAIGSRMCRQIRIKTQRIPASKSVLMVRSNVFIPRV